MVSKNEIYIKYNIIQVMMKFEGRIASLQNEITKSEFLEGKGLGNEIPFWIFDYPPEKELLMRNTIAKLIKYLDSTSISTIQIDLYELMISIIDKELSLEKIQNLEKEKGSSVLVEKLGLILKPPIIVNEIKNKLLKNTYDLVLVSGVGKAWPLVRSHDILNNLQAIIKHTFRTPT